MQRHESRGRRRTHKVTVHAWLASHSRDASCARVAAVSWRSSFLSASWLCPSPEALPNCPICRNGLALSFPNRAHDFPWTLLTFYKMPEIPPPPPPPSAPDMHAPTPAGVGTLGGGHQSARCVFFPFDFSVFTALYGLLRCSCSCSDGSQYQRVTTQSNPTMRAVWISSLTKQCKHCTRHVQSRLEPVLCNLSFVQIHSLLLRSLLFFFFFFINNVYIFSGSLMQG